MCIGEGWEGGREERGEIQEEIASGALIRPWLIREWFADFYLAHQFALEVVLVLFDSNKRVWIGPSHFLPAEPGKLRQLGWAGNWAPLCPAGNAQCLGTLADSPCSILAATGFYSQV